MRADGYYKDLREAGINFLHRVNAEKEDQNAHDSFERILAPALGWATLTRQTLIDFFYMMYKKSKTGDNRKTWFNVDWLNAVEDRRDTEEYKQHPRIMMEPFNDKNVNQEERYKRLSQIISMAFSGMFFLEELQKIVQDRSSLLDFVIEPDERKYVFRLKNITHVVDADSLHSESQQKLRAGIRELVGNEMFEIRVEQITRLTILMKLILNIVSDKKEVEGSFESLLSFVEKEMTKFKNGLSDTSNLTRRIQIKERIDAMKWGPKEYQRDAKVIQEAQALLTRHGILTLQGVGAVGKTALANKLLLNAADEDLYDRYITQSTKVDSDQGELDFDSSNGNLITETTEQNSLYRSMLDPVSKKISGGMRRVCFDILQSIDPLYDSTTHKNAETEILIGKALEIMEKHSLLICIDNFEDIESPAEGMSPRLLSEVNQENKNFQSFFKQWANIYSSKTTTENQQRFSKIIITTRGKGEKTQVVPYPVPSLSKEENFNLFVSKLQSKVRIKLLEANTLTWVQENSTRINQLFDEWTLPVSKIKKGFEQYQFHPAYTLFAGGSVKAANGDFGVESQIKRWDPDGAAADQVREYVTSKIFGNVTKEEIDIFAALMRGGIEKTFDHRTIQDITQDDEEWKHDDNWDWEKRNNFIREYSDNRDFFVETNLGGHYEWNRFYFKEIKKHFKNEYPDKNVEQDADELDDEETNIQVHEEKISIPGRRDLEIWLSDDKLSNSIFKEKNKTFNTVILNLKKEANLTELNAASALIMLIGNDYIGARDHVIQNLFTSKCPSNNVFAKFRKPTDKIGKGSGGKNTPKSTLETKFKNDNFHHVWDYFNVIRNEIETHLSSPKYQKLTLMLQQILCSEAERCFENKLIELEELLDFYSKSVKIFTNLSKEEKHYQDEDFNEIVTSVIHNYVKHLRVVPEDIYSDLSSNAQFNIHFKTMLDFIDVLPSLYGKQMPLLGKFFWIALRYIATLENDFAIYEPNIESYVRKLHEYESYAAEESQKLNSAFIRRKKNRVLTNFKRIVWPVDNIDNVDIKSGGLVGKLVYYTLGKSYNTKLNIQIRRGDINSASYLKDKEYKKLRNKTYPYTIAYVSKSNLYLEPLVNLDGAISNNPEKLEDINQLKAKIVEDLIKCKIKHKKICERWPEFSKRFNEWKCLPSLNKKEEMDQAKGLQTLIQEHISEVNIHFFENRANEVYVKFSPFTPKEKESLQRYEWESHKQYKEKETKLIWTIGPDQISLPRNPKAYAELLDALFIQIQEEWKYKDALAKLKSDADKKLVRILLTRLFRIGDDKKAMFHNFENESFDKNKYPTKGDLWSGLRRRYYGVATWLRHRQEYPDNITEILERYFIEAKRELSD
jgi:hypothetical protein